MSKTLYMYLQFSTVDAESLPKWKSQMDQLLTNVSGIRFDMDDDISVVRDCLQRKNRHLLHDFLF